MIHYKYTKKNEIPYHIPQKKYQKNEISTCRQTRLSIKCGCGKQQGVKSLCDRSVCNICSIGEQVRR